MANEERIRELFTGHPDYITVGRLGSGYAAIHMRWYDDIKAYDVLDTGMGRFAIRETAEIEAKTWAFFDEIELRITNGK